MFILVLFTDEIFLICEPNDVSAFTTKCPAVKFTDGKKYTARIVALHEDRETLQHIQKCLEEESNTDFFKSLQFTQEKLSYSDILKRHKQYKDAGKLYLDSTIFSPQRTNIEDCALILREQKETKKFFKIQSHFVQGVMLLAQENASAMENPNKSNSSALGHEEISIGLDVTEKSISVNESLNKRTTNLIPQKISQIPENNPSTILREKNSTERNSADQILASNNVQAKISVSEKNISVKERPCKLTTSLIIDEKIPPVHELAGKLCAENFVSVEISVVQDHITANKSPIEPAVILAVDEKIPTGHNTEDDMRAQNVVEGETSTKVERMNAKETSSDRSTSPILDEISTTQDRESHLLTEKLVEHRMLITGKKVSAQEGLRECIALPIPHEKISTVSAVPLSPKHFVHREISTSELHEVPKESSVQRPTSPIGDEKISTVPNVENQMLTKVELTKQVSKVQAHGTRNSKNYGSTKIMNGVTSSIERTIENHIFTKNIMAEDDCEEKIRGEKAPTCDVSKVRFLSDNAFENYTNNEDSCIDPISRQISNVTETKPIPVVPISNEKTAEHTIVDQSEKIVTYNNESGQVLDNSGVDENCNSVMGKVKEPDYAGKDINANQVLHQSERDCYLTDNCNGVNFEMSIDEEFKIGAKIVIGEDKWCLYQEDDQGKPGNQESLEVGVPQEVDIGTGLLIPLLNTTYPLDLMNLDLSADANSQLDYNGISQSGSKPRVVKDVMLSANERLPRPNSGNDFTLSDSLSPSRPIGNSTALETFESCTDVGDDDIVEDPASGKDSDSDSYVPSAGESSDTEISSAEDQIPEASTSRKRSEKTNKSLLNITLGVNKPGTSAPDDTQLEVSISKKSTYSKKHFCFYCQKFQTKLARHLEIAHKEEEDVKKFSALPPKNVERMQIISAIRKNGNHLYNTDRRFNNGELLVVRRPQERMKRTAQDFLACGVCKGQYSRSVIRHHFAKCAKKDGKKERLVVVKGRKVSARVHEKASKSVRQHIMPYLREDAIVRGVRYDKLMMLYANKQCEKYGFHQHHYPMIRGRIRLLGRFLMAIKERNSTIKEFADVFKPRNYDDTIEAVRVVAGFNESVRTFEHPAVAANLGTLLKHVGEILRSEYIKEERAQDQKRVDDFMKLQCENYGTSVNRAVLETQLQNNRRKKVILPNTEDITKLHNFLKSEREVHVESLKKEFSEDSWRKLAETLLISLQLFNRRRPGEMERVYLEDFNSQQGIDAIADKDAFNALTKQGQALAKKYVRFMARGKLGRGVPVLVPANLLSPINLVLKYRSQAGVPDENPYLFGIPSRDRDRVKYLRACDLLRQFSEQCGAGLPSTLRGTQLRKHVATKCINLNLDENQVSDLANFMGHADKIHKEIYRQPVIEKDIIKISQLLEIAQGTKDSSPNNENSSEEDDEDSDASTGNNSSRKGKTPSKSREMASASQSKATHRRWTEEERTTVLGAFEKKMRSGKMPTGEEMQKLIAENDCLKGREVAQLRTWLHTQKKKKF